MCTHILNDGILRSTQYAARASMACIHYASPLAAVMNGAITSASLFPACHWAEEGRRGHETTLSVCTLLVLLFGRGRRYSIDSIHSACRQQYCSTTYTIRRYNTVGRPRGGPSSTPGHPTTPLEQTARPPKSNVQRALCSLYGGNWVGSSLILASSSSSSTSC